MHKVFLYDNKIDLGMGMFASVGGFKLVDLGKPDCLEAIQDDENQIFGYLYDVNDGVLDGLDTYYGLGIDLHKRILVQARLLGGAPISAFMYEYQTGDE